MHGVLYIIILVQWRRWRAPHGACRRLATMARDAEEYCKEQQSMLPANEAFQHNDERLQQRWLCIWLPPLYARQRRVINTPMFWTVSRLGGQQASRAALCGANAPLSGRQSARYVVPVNTLSVTLLAPSISRHVVLLVTTFDGYISVTLSYTAYTTAITHCRRSSQIQYTCTC